MRGKRAIQADFERQRAIARRGLGNSEALFQALRPVEVPFFELGFSRQTSVAVAEVLALRRRTLGDAHGLQLPLPPEAAQRQAQFPGGRPPGLALARDDAHPAAGEIGAQILRPVGRLVGGRQIGQGGPLGPGDMVFAAPDILLHRRPPAGVLRCHVRRGLLFHSGWRPLRRRKASRPRRSSNIIRQPNQQRQYEKQGCQAALILINGPHYRARKIGNIHLVSPDKRTCPLLFLKIRVYHNNKIVPQRVSSV